MKYIELNWTELEIEQEGKLPFLDMVITRDDSNKLHSSWYRKGTDTGLLLNYHAIAPMKYKRAVVSGMVHRIHSASSSWTSFNTGIEEAKRILESNQFPPAFYNPIITGVNNKLVVGNGEGVSTTPAEGSANVASNMLRLQYRGHATDRFINKLRKAAAPVASILTTRKLRTCLPSLKSQSSAVLRSRMVYKLTCSGCNACYVGCTTQHLTTRVQQHRVRGTPVRKHFDQCGTKVVMEHAQVLDCTIRNDGVLLTLEALHIRELRPSINTRDEYRARKLTLKF